MIHFDEAKELVGHAANEMPKLEKAYQAALHEQNIKPAMLIEIKNVMENLRSALDFTAHGLFDKYGSSSRANPNIYFPYALASQSQAEFQRANRIEACIPGLAAVRPDIVAKIESYQHFAGLDNRWLPLFMELNNENKHQRLTPQKREEQRSLEIASGGVSMSLGPGCSISMGPGTLIQMGGMHIPGGQVISGNSPARYMGTGEQRVTIWVSFHFSTNNEPVVPFLKNAIKKIGGIVDELSVI